MNSQLIVVKGKVIEQRKNFSAEVGEDIGYEEGSRMIKNFFDENPDDVMAFFMGRNMFNALNEMGIKQLVLVGVDINGNNVLQYTTVDDKGSMVKNKGIVADRNMICPPFCGDGDGTGDGTISWY